MDERMKVMIAYDGSSHAKAAIEDLSRAGLPVKTEALVVSVVDMCANTAPVSEFDLTSLLSRRAEAVLATARNRRNRQIVEAKESAANVVRRLRIQFPEWKIGYQVLQGKPADELLRKAEEWQPDMIVVGSQGHSAFWRFFLGSVSKTLAESAACAVRVVRRAQLQNN